MNSLILGISFFLLDQLMERRESLRRQVFLLQQIHHETFSGSTEETIDELAHRVPGEFRSTHSGRVDIGFVFESPLNFLLAMQHGEHRLHGGVSQFPFEFTLNYLNGHGSGFPEHLHDLQLQGRHLFTLAAWHSGSSPKTLGGQYSRDASVSTKTLVVPTDERG